MQPTVYPLVLSFGNENLLPFITKRKNTFGIKRAVLPPKHKSEKNTFGQYSPKNHKSEKDIPTKTQVGRKHSQALREDILKYSHSHTHLRPLVPHLCLLAPIVIMTFFSPKLLTE